MSVLDLSPPPAGPAEANLEPFFQQIRAVNPFTDNRVNGPGATDVDVSTIHQAAFERLTGLAGEALRARRGLGAVLWGEAGVGKSHLLARLAGWASDQGRACFVYLHNLQAAPDHLPRSLLHSVVSVLTLGRRARFHGTPLFDLVHGAILEAVGHDLRFRPWSRLERDWAAFVDRLVAGGLIDRTPFEVLYQFFRSCWRHEQGKEDGSAAEVAVRWLAGQALDPVQARFLGLPAGRQRNEPVALADNQEVKQVLVALTRLAGSRGRPFVLAFDQVDNLDEEQAAALGRFLEALIDSSPNLLTVTAGVQNTLFRWLEARVIQESAWHRLAQFEVLLQRLTAPQAVELVRRRLEHFLTPFAGLEPVARRQAEDDLFPLGQGWRERFLRDKVEVRPRDVINWAREGWRQQQEALREQGGSAWLDGWPGTPHVPAGGPVSPEQVREAIDRKVDEKLAEHRDRRLREPETLPPDADQLAGLLHALLVQCRDAGFRYGVVEVQHIQPPRRGARPAYDLAVEQQGPDNGKSVRAGVVVLTAESAVSATSSLRRLVEDTRSPLDRLLLVTDARVGLHLGTRGNEYLDELRQGGRFRSLELTLPEYAELDALQAVVGLAHSGDLEVDLQPGQARPVSPEEVVESHHRRGRYLAARLLRTLLEWPASGALA